VEVYDLSRREGSDAGGMAAAWIETVQNASGRIEIVAIHSFFGKKAAKIKVGQEKEMI
jgi:hypothetical protein